MNEVNRQGELEMERLEMDERSFTVGSPAVIYWMNAVQMIVRG